MGKVLGNIFVGLGVLCAVLLFASSAAPEWSAVQTKVEIGGYFSIEVKHVWNLWIVQKSGDLDDNDDTIKKDSFSKDDDKMWSAIQVNRGSTLFSGLVCLASAVIYAVLYNTKRMKIGELFSAFLVLFVALLQLGAAGAYAATVNKYTDDDTIDDRIVCGAGCALEFVAGILSLVTAIGMVVTTTCVDKGDATDAPQSAESAPGLKLAPVEDDV